MVVGTPFGCPVAAVQVERFWDIYSHLIRPQEVHGSMEYYVFRDGIKPLWEVCVVACRWAAAQFL
jgi:hypothetical protein